MIVILFWSNHQINQIELIFFLMGATEIKNGTITERSTKQYFSNHNIVSLNYFEFKYIIGRGGFGKVIIL